MTIPEITSFQMRSLSDAATGTSPYYQLVLPRQDDELVWRKRLIRNNNETDELVEMGMLDNISLEFGKQIAQNIREHGRSFRVFRITDLGRLLFMASNGSQLVH